MKFQKNSDTLIIIPVFNEAENIGNVIEDLFKKCKDTDVLIINDGSLDKTAEILAGRDVFVVRHIFNMGIGTCLETGCQFALANGYDYIVRMDGDGQHDASFINVVLSPVINGEVDIAIGSRFLKKAKFTTSRFRLIGIWLISFILKLITGKIVTDPTSGFCSMNKKAFEYFSQNCPDDYPEPEILLCRRQFKIKEVPISISRRYEGASSITPLKSIYYMVKVLLSLFVNIFRKERK